MNNKEIVVFYFDTPANYHLAHTQEVIGKRLYKDTILVEDKNDFKKEYDKLIDKTPYVLVCHVFHSEDKTRTKNSGYRKFKSEGIEDEYNIDALLVSSGDSGNVMKNIFKDEHDNKTVYSYNKIHENIKSDRIKVNVKGEEITTIKVIENISVKKGIFLSHSSKDKEVINKFRALILESGLTYDPKLIKFTSEEDFGIPGGINIPEDLKSFLKNEMGLFIQFLTPNYIESRVCLNEEGAGWCLLDDKKYFIPFIIPPNTHDLLSWIKNADKGISINNKDSLLNIYEHRKDFFGSDVNITRLIQKIEEFIKYFDGEIKKQRRHNIT